MHRKSCFYSQLRLDSFLTQFLFFRSTDPSENPLIRTYRWSIRSVYKDAPLFSKPIGSSPVHIHLEELYIKLTLEVCNRNVCQLFYVAQSNVKYITSQG